ncbi:MAG: class I SAM-dependent methyltransferase [Spirochaetales bacterium]|nr:class I SAM-dependent methyltransferase [Spirochaetales bacterium]
MYEFFEPPVPLGEDGVPLEPARLLHLPGEMNIDIYPPLIFVTLYREMLAEEVSSLSEVLEKRFPACPLYVQDRSVRPFTVVLERGEIPEEMTVKEGELEFFLHPKRGQNAGFFIDMRDGRRVIGEIVVEQKAKGNGKVLNLFSYTCSLSVAALAAGAERVVNIDMNRKSLDVGKRNHRLNHGNIPGGYGTQALFLPHDIFKSLGKLRREGPYGLIIADPPPSQKGSFDLRKDYPRLLKRLPEMLAPGGEMLLSLNSPVADWEDFERLVFDNLGPEWDVQRIAPPADFRPAEEGRGLKLLRVKQSL